MNNLVFSYSIVSSMIYFLVVSIFGMDVSEEGGTASYHVFSALLAALCSFLFFREYKLSKIRCKYFYFSLLIMAFVLIAGLLSNDPTNSYYLQFIVLCIPASLAGLYFSNYNNAIKMIKWLDIYMLIISFSMILSLPKFYVKMLTSDEYYSQTMSYNAAFAFLMSFYLLNNKDYTNRFSFTRKKLYKLICIIIMPIMIFTIFFSGGRGGFVTLAVGVLCFLFFSDIPKRKMIKWGVVSFFVILLGISFVIQNSSDELLLFLERSSGRLFSYISGGKLDLSATSGRDYIINQAMDLVYERPILGYGLFDYIKELGTYPHNIFVEWLLQGGIVFFTFAMLLWFGIVLKGIRIFKNKRELVSILPLILFPFSLLLFSGSWVSHPFFWFSVFFIMNYNRVTIGQQNYV